MNVSKLWFALFLVFFWTGLNAQSKKVYPVAFYNLENLFDTEHDPKINDTEFTPEGANNWTETKYQQKLSNMAYAISTLGSPYVTNGPAVLGVCELENRRVLEDLIKTEPLNELNLGIEHYDSPDRRGVDVALIYNKDLFRPISSKAFKYVLDRDTSFKTRDQLLVTGELDGDTINIIVNHWPSRYGSKSSGLREHAAALTKSICDSLYKVHPDAKIIIMGDLNDDPTDKSVKEVLKAKKTISEVGHQGLYNTMWHHYARGIGSLAYQGRWNLFDQIIISKPLLENKNGKLRYIRSEVYNRDFLIQQEGRYKGAPHRTFSANVFINGFSDHLPTLIYLTK